MYNYKSFGLNNAAHDLMLLKSLETNPIASSLYGKHAEVATSDKRALQE